MASRQVSRLFVGNIKWTVSREQLIDYFSAFGKVRNAQLMFNPKTGLSRGYGFVQFQNEAPVTEILAKGSHVLEGTDMRVRPTTERSPDHRTN